ncbi:hypothetical protein [Streptomyces formicae]
MNREALDKILEDSDWECADERCVYVIGYMGGRATEAMKTGKKVMDSYVTLAAVANDMCSAIAESDFEAAETFRTRLNEAYADAMIITVPDDASSLCEENES